MSTPILDKLSKDLSYKIFDPVSSSETNGEIFSSELRKNYLTRATNKLLRLLEIVHPFMDEVLSDYYNVLDLTDYLLNDVSLPETYTLVDFYYRPSPKGALSKAYRMNPEEYLAIKSGRDSFHTADLTKRYWTIIDNKIKILPDVLAFYHDTQGLVKKSFQDLELEDILIPSNYHDMLLNIAAQEAMADKGDWTTFNIYRQLVESDVAIIANWKAMKIREGEYGK